MANQYSRDKTQSQKRYTTQEQRQYLDNKRAATQGQHASQARDQLSQAAELRQESWQDELPYAELPDSDLLLDIEYDPDETRPEEPADSDKPNRAVDAFSPPSSHINAMVIEPEQSYWLEVVEYNGTMQCRFRQPDWLSNPTPQGTARRTVERILTTTASWLEQHGQDYLREPTAEHYARLQGAYHKEIKTESIVTKEGLITKLDLLPDKTEPKKSDLKNLNTDLTRIFNHSYLIWPQQMALPLTIWLESADYSHAWIAEVLNAYGTFKKRSFDWFQIATEKQGIRYAVLTDLLKNIGNGVNLASITTYLQKLSEPE
ncbi:hypothetical protein D5085_00920 [Ectothiorhodospiraceae bacterium BW-2]|nr:hypothetical protein D5085_00920 [Ectothiorhodospiraceae bacterium BW-2]